MGTLLLRLKVAGKDLVNMPLEIPVSAGATSALYSLVTGDGIEGGSLRRRRRLQGAPEDGGRRLCSRPFLSFSLSLSRPITVSKETYCREKDSASLIITQPTGQSLK